MSYKLRFSAVKFISYFKSFNPEENFYIFSDPRGGSTWLSDLISSVPKTSAMWEPLHLSYSKPFRDLDFRIRQHIPDGGEWPEAYELFEKLFSGKMWNIFSAKRVNPMDFLTSNQLIFKVCRGNLLMPWLTENFNFRYLPIYMVRNPYAVIASQLQQGSWHYMQEEFPEWNDKFSENYEIHRPFLKEIKGKEAVLAAVWCLSNIPIFNHPKNDVEWIFIKYEDLFLNPMHHIQSIFDRWKLEIPNEIENIVNKPSFTSKNLPDFENKQNHLTKWQECLKPAQIESIKRVLVYFNENLYSSI